MTWSLRGEVRADDRIGRHARGGAQPIVCAAHAIGSTRALAGHADCPRRAAERHRERAVEYSVSGPVHPPYSRRSAWPAARDALRMPPMLFRALGTATPATRYTKAECLRAFERSEWYARLD